MRLQFRDRQTVMPNVYILVVLVSPWRHMPSFLRMARSFCQIMQARGFVFHTGLIGHGAASAAIVVGCKEKNQCCDIWVGNLAHASRQA